MLHLIDSFLNRITMYRLVLYGLLILAAYTVFMGLSGFISFTATQLLFSGTILFITCYVTNYLLAKTVTAPTNVESSTITSLILFFILSPFSETHQIATLVLAGVIAMTSKYLLAIHKKHLFNPAAIAAVILGIMGSPQVSWWIASSVLIPLTLIVGLLIVRKIRRFTLFFSFIITSFLVLTISGIAETRNLIDLWIETIISWPIIFLATIMLTEPATTPPTKKLQMIYGSLVGVFFNIPFHFGPIFSTPELALALGNIFSYIVSPKQKLFLTFKEKVQLANQTYEFVFQPNQKPTYHAGQYLEWTLPHAHADSRGNRRYFTVASAPTEQEIRLGVRFNTPPSSFKKDLLDLPKGKQLVAGQLGGDFTLPQDATEKLVFIAGGIGITPFRSMTKYLLDTKEKRDIVLLYANKTEEEIAYKELFGEALRIGMKTVYILSDAQADWQGKTGHIDEKMLQEEIVDYKERTYYLSGPIAMVDAYKRLLKQIGIATNKIVTDYFPGF
ncbi:MAG: oxidoreductase [Patescibacteria group bacterium]